VPLQVRNCDRQAHRIVPELSEATIAVETEQSPDTPGHMVVVDVIGHPREANSALPSLLLPKPLEPNPRKPVSVLQVIEALSTPTLL
jgi:hypothetical protein